jgi:ABC-type branched-subunit amino acid transport system ATPase component/ABC-type branched-subunit amino acid transport system permease subunit
VTGRGAAVYVAAAALAVALVGWVWIAPFSLLGTANLAMSYTLVAISLVVLTGWVGQISLAQASFVGIGAFVTGVAARNWGIPFPLTLPIGALASAGVAAAFGVVALRVRGLYLAVATLIFAWMAQEFLFNQSWLAGVGGSASSPSKPIGEQGSFPYLDFTQRATFYFVMLACVAATIVACANVRDSKTGRAWFAVKGSEIAAASLGIGVTRYKLLAFAVSGFIAGAAGTLEVTHQQVATSSAFAPNVSLFYLAIAVVGGLSSLPGAVASGMLFASLEEIFYRVRFLDGYLHIVSAALLVVVLLFFPAGLAGVPSRLEPPARRAATGLAGMVRALMRRLTADDDGLDDREEPTDKEADEEADERADEVFATRRLAQRLVARLRPGPAATTPDALAPTLAAASSSEESLVAASLVAPVPATLAYEPGTATKPSLPPRDERRLVLSARDVTVRFGGLTAVDNAHLEVRESEIVGLIGPNGAGKTTLFNAISGLNEPTEGTVELFGTDITKLQVHERARLGMGRTFQIIQLFPQLSVFENLLVATHLRNGTGFFSHVAATQGAIAEERAVRERVRKVVSLLGLEEVTDRNVAGLPFGMLRLVEVARALVTGAPFVMLDEPASGLDSAETDKLCDLLLWVRESLAVSLLVIEHDVKMVTELTDYVYVIERGRPIADGTPSEIQRDEAVIAAYLGRPTREAVEDAREAEEVSR